MIDVHCHVNFHAFENDYDQVIQDAQKAGITTIINVGTKLDSSQKAVDLAQQYEHLYAIVGVHPHHADKIALGANWIDQLEQIATSSKKVVAIGEIGMDYYRYQSNGVVDKAVQREVFTKQIELAAKLKLPLQIHNRHAGEDIVEILTQYKKYLLDTPGMFHCFAGTKEVLKKILDMGFYVGFDGNLTYKGLAPGETVSLSELVVETPLERIVIETDSPFLTPIPYRGSRNSPAYAILVGQKIAEIKGVPFEIIDEQTTKNAQAIFNIATRN